MLIEDLIKQFELPFNDFSDPILWNDGIGFSVTQSHTDNYESLYKFGIFEEDPKRKLKKLYISVSYGKKTDAGIALGTGKRGIWDPIDLDFHNEFFYDEDNNLIFFENEEIAGKDLLIFIEKLHKKPTKLVPGIPIRMKLWFWRKVLPFFIKIVDIILIKILWIISGEKFPKDIIHRYFDGQRIEETTQKIPELEIVKGKTMNFFGYEAKRWAVVFYCSFHLIIYVLLLYTQNYNNLLAHKIGSNNFLSLCYVVVSFTITESLIPKMIKNFIKKTPKIFTTVAFKTIKVR